jgi:hypothetical protein
LNIFGCILEPCIETWQFFLNFGRMLAVENLKIKHMILALLISNIPFWLHITSKESQPQALRSRI